MKIVTLIAGVTLCATLATQAVPGIIYPVKSSANFRLLAIGQNANYELVSTRTRPTSTATNMTTVYKSTVTNTPVLTGDILALLENSFQTTFPEGAQLQANGTSFLVMDSTGTNLILNVASVLSIHVKPPYLHSGVYTLTSTQDSAGTHSNGRDLETYTEIMTVEYDDTGLTTADGTQTVVEFNGLMSIRTSRTFDTGKVTTTFILNGQGGGTVRGKNMILKGTVSGAGSSVPST